MPARGDEHAIASAALALLGGVALDAAVELFLGHVLGKRRGQAELVGVGGVDAAQQRLHESLVRFVAQTAAGERADAFVAGFAFARRGTNGSASSRILPRQLRIRVVRIGQSLLGVISTKPLGTRWSSPLWTTSARRRVSSVGMSWSARPIRWQRSRAQGYLVMKLSAERSMR